MKRLHLPVEAVRERDIDFLLVEELLSSDTFVKFFLEMLSLPKCDYLVSVERSIHDFGLGETDVLMKYTSDARTIGILIENKLDALFQPNQAQRYTSRAEHYVGQGIYHHTYSVLIAPQQYIERQNEFTHALSYESIVEFYKKSSLGKRADFKISLLTIAIEKLRRGYVAVNSEPNQRFWMAYYDYLSDTLPDIYMKPVSIVPAKSDWIELYIGEVKITHKLHYGYLDTTGLHEHSAQKLKQQFIGRTKELSFKSGRVLRITSSPLDRMKSFDSQIDAVNACLNDIDEISRLVSVA